MPSQDSRQGAARVAGVIHLSIVDARFRGPRSLALALASLLLSTLANAGVTTFETRLDFPVPGRDVGSSQLGIGAGMSVTSMESRHGGIGLDLVYHYWPASPSYVRAFDRWLQATRYEALDGSEWAIPATQLTAHLKIVATGGTRGVPWAKLGAGYYWLGRNVDERFTPDAYVRLRDGGLPHSVLVPGWYGSIGIDRLMDSPSLGLDATFHYVLCRDTEVRNALPDFTALTLGMHLSFGRR